MRLGYSISQSRFDRYGCNENFIESLKIHHTNGIGQILYIMYQTSDYVWIY